MHWNYFPFDEFGRKTDEKLSICEILMLFNQQNGVYYNILTIFLKKRS